MLIYVQNYRSYDLEQQEADDAKEWQDSLSPPTLSLPQLFPPTPSPQEPSFGLPLPKMPPRPIDRLVGNRSAKPQRPSSGRTVANGVRIAELEGRPHYVVPVVMLSGNERDGMVMAGSGGPVLYPPSETAKTVHLWNGRPIVRDHPDLHGVSSANNPDAYSRQRIGVVFNARIDGGRLVAEAWLDVERTKAVDSRIVDAVLNGRILEVSTGLFLEQTIRNGTVGGRAYRAVASNYRPDHLAILPDTVGACSVKDGCGLLRNSANVPRVPFLSLPSLG